MEKKKNLKGEKKIDWLRLLSGSLGKGKGGRAWRHEGDIPLMPPIRPPAVDVFIAAKCSLSQNVAFVKYIKILLYIYHISIILSFSL